MCVALVKTEYLMTMLQHLVTSNDYAPILNETFKYPLADDNIPLVIAIGLNLCLVRLLIASPTLKVGPPNVGIVLR